MRFSSASVSSEFFFSAVPGTCLIATDHQIPFKLISFEEEDTSAVTSKIQGTRANHPSPAGRNDLNQVRCFLHGIPSSSHHIYSYGILSLIFFHLHVFPVFSSFFSSRAKGLKGPSSPD